MLIYFLVPDIVSLTVAVFLCSLLEWSTIVCYCQYLEPSRKVAQIRLFNSVVVFSRSTGNFCALWHKAGETK